jgi:hypothetical protein
MAYTDKRDLRASTSHYYLAEWQVCHTYFERLTRTLRNATENQEEEKSTFQPIRKLPLLS